MISAKKMSAVGYKPSQVNLIVKEQLMVINNKIRAKDKTWGINSIVHSLPVDFGLPGLSKADAQTLIYSRILAEALKAGYKTEIDINARKNRTSLAIYWESDITEKAKEAMIGLIAKASLPIAERVLTEPSATQISTSNQATPRISEQNKRPIRR
jgi:hypothetical protein